MPEVVKKKRKKIANKSKDKFLPFMVVLVAVLAFAVGILWQKVSDLEKGSVKVGNAGEAPAAPPPSKISDLEGIASSIGLDVSEFNKCMSEKRHADKVENIYQGGLTAGVTGTPGNFIVNKNGDTWSLPGAVPINTLKETIDAALGESSSTTKLSVDQASLIPTVSASDHVRGNRNADVFLIEYSDFECPFCARFHPTAAQALEDYDGQVAWVYRHFPLDTIHPKARPAAEASECAAELGGNDAFWEFVDVAFGV